MTILHITQHGKGLETDALENGTTMPKIKGFVIGDGIPPATQSAREALTALVHQTYQTPVLLKDRVSPSVLKLVGSIPEDVSTYVREIGLVLEDDSLYAYGVYASDAPNGEATYKGAGFAMTFTTIISRETQGNLTFTYSPIDVQQIATQISDDARASLDLYLQQQLITINMVLSSLTATVYQQQEQINTLKSRLGYFQ